MNIIGDTRKSRQFSVGIVLASFYIFFMYVAKGAILNENFSRISLYLFLFWAVLNTVKSKTITINSYFKWYLVFIIFCCISLIYADYSSNAFDSLYPLLVTLGVTYAFSLAIKKETDFYIIFWIYTISATILILILFFTGNLYTAERLGTELFGNANAFAHFIVISTVCSIWLFINTKRIPKIIALICIALQMYALALSGGRKSLFFPIIFLYLLLMLRNDKKGRKHIVKYTFGFAIITLVMIYMIMNIPVLYESVGTRMEALYNSFITGEGSYDASTLVRQKMIDIGLSGWYEKPLFGHGVDNYKYTCLIKLSRLSYAHNNFIEILFDVGIIGFFIYYGFYAYIVKKLITTKKADIELKNFFISFTISLIIFEYGAITYNETYVQIMLAFAAIYLSFDKKINIQGELKC